MKLIEKITNGSQISINETGTRVNFTPGFITGGKISFDCGNSRSIGYYLEGIIPLLIFGKNASQVTFIGITNDNTDLSVDTIKSVILPFLSKYGINEGLSLSIKVRGAPPEGGGQVIFTCPSVRSLTSISILEEGLIKRVRGTAYSTRVSPQISNRMIDKARSVFTNFLSDVYIFSDHFKGKEGGNSSGYGMNLIAETTEGILYSAEYYAEAGSTPEDIGEYAAKLLLEEINKRGCVDTSLQSLALLLMVLCPEDVSKIRIGKLSQYTIQYIRHLKDFFGITFKIKEDENTNTLIFSCVGIGYSNVSRKVI